MPTLLTRGVVLPLASSGRIVAACAVIAWKEILSPLASDGLRRELWQALAGADTARGYHRQSSPDLALTDRRGLSSRSDRRISARVPVRELRVATLTDSLAVDGSNIPPANVVCFDARPVSGLRRRQGHRDVFDPANEIALDAGFWLGDAFASGGRVGYDHKAMAITARGAWISVQRHFRELGIDVHTDPVTVVGVGVGDMSGDVFGNGMLLSETIRLVAAFDHRHIFLDPTPDAAASFAERQRLFALPLSSWDDDDKALLSPGGIGTYVKAAGELNNDVGDRANDAHRIDGAMIGARVFGKGANLGLTQAGRIEFASLGGRLNADFIDNSAGVDCSDNEVDIKIALNAEVAAGRLTDDARNTLRASMIAASGLVSSMTWTICHVSTISCAL